MDRLAFFAAVLLATITTLLLGLGLLLPDSNAPAPLKPHRHVFRLPQGAQRRGSRLWVWENETVRGVFRVYSGEGDPASGERKGKNKAAVPCCGQLEGRLFEAEGYEIEAANDGSFPAASMLAVFADAASRWEAVVGNRFGSQSSVGESAGLVFNGRNQVGLGALDVDVSGALAVTGLWMVCPGGGSVSGCPTVLEIAEWDQTYAIAERDWSLVGAAGAYDLPSVAVHEFGHNVGLDDLSDSACVSSTMYGFSGTGETFRRSLDADTKACARDLYGISGAAGAWRGALLACAMALMF